MSKHTPNHNSLETIFDGKNTQWGDAVFIQKYQDAIFKCLDMTADNIQTYINLTNALKNEVFTMSIDKNEMNFHALNKNKSGGIDIIGNYPIEIISEQGVQTINKIEVIFNPINGGPYPVSDIKQRPDSVESEPSFIYTAPYIAGDTLLDFYCEQNNRGYGDLSRKIHEITQNIHTFICDFFENNPIYTISGNLNPDIVAVNLKVTEIKNGTLYLTITDIGSSIEQLVKDTKKITIQNSDLF